MKPGNAERNWEARKLTGYLSAQPSLIANARTEVVLIVVAASIKTRFGNAFGRLSRTLMSAATFRIPPLFLESPTPKQVLQQCEETYDCFVALRVSRRDNAKSSRLPVPPLTRRATAMAVS
jgi:hypothetical protein